MIGKQNVPSETEAGDYILETADLNIVVNDNFDWMDNKRDSNVALRELTEAIPVGRFIVSRKSSE